MELVLAEQIRRIVKTKALVPIQDGSIELREQDADMTVEVVDVPSGATVVNLNKIGRLSGIEQGAATTVAAVLGLSSLRVQNRVWSSLVADQRIGPPCTYLGADRSATGEAAGLARAFRFLQTISRDFSTAAGWKEIPIRLAGVS